MNVSTELELEQELNEHGEAIVGGLLTVWANMAIHGIINTEIQSVSQSVSHTQTVKILIALRHDFNKYIKC